MTALGKILVFFNLLLALVTGGLVVQVYLTRTNWKKGFEDAVAETKVAVAAVAAEKTLSKKKEAELAADKSRLEKQIEGLKGDLAGRQAEVADLKTEAEKARTEQNKETENSKAASREIDKLKLERDQMTAQLNERNARIAKLEKDVADITARETFARIRADQTEKDNDEKRAEIAHLSKRVEEFKFQLRQFGAAPGVPPANKPRIPTVEQAGQITGVAENIVVISLGSDHGVEPGHIMQVYRTKPDAVYLGTITITKTENRQAVGLFQPAKPNLSVAKGDTVDSRIQR